MNKALTWKVTSGVLALALVIVNVIVPGYTKYQETQKINKVVEFLGGYETAPNDAAKDEILRRGSEILNPETAGQVRAEAALPCDSLQESWLVILRYAMGHPETPQLRAMADLYLDRYIRCVDAVNSPLLQLNND